MSPINPSSSLVLAVFCLSSVKIWLENTALHSSREKRGVGAINFTQVDFYSVCGHPPTAGSLQAPEAARPLPRARGFLGVPPAVQSSACRMWSKSGT